MGEKWRKKNGGGAWEEKGEKKAHHRQWWGRVHMKWKVNERKRQNWNFEYTNQKYWDTLTTHHVPTPGSTTYLSFIDLTPLFFSPFFFLSLTFKFRYYDFISCNLNKIRKISWKRRALLRLELKPLLNYGSCVTIRMGFVLTWIKLVLMTKKSAKNL